MAYLMVCKERQKFIVAGRYDQIYGNVKYKFRTIVSEISSFVGNPALYKLATN